MPIRNLTDRVMPAFPRLGRLRKGSEKGDKGIGQDLPYFRFTSDREDVAKTFLAAYGPKPAMLRCFLPYAGIDDNWQAWREKWVGGGMVHRCDGEVMEIWLGKDGRYHRNPQPCPYAGKVQTEVERKKDPACEEVGRLVVILPELWQAGYIGYCTLESHSVNDIIAIQACLMAVAEARADSPLGLRGIEFVLRRVREAISTPGTDGKRVRREKWLVKLEPAADWARLRLLAARNAAMNEPALISPSDGAATGEVVDPGEALEGDQVEDLDVEPLDGQPPAEFAEEDWRELEEQARQQAQQPPPPQQQEQGNGGAVTVTRPAPPTTVKGWLVSKAAQGSQAPVEQNLRGVVIEALEKLFYDRPKEERVAARHRLLAFLFGNESTTALTDGQARAVLAWAAQDGKVSNVAAAEARLVAAAPQQQAMIGEEQAV